MSGWKFLERQRRDPALASIPVLILSAAVKRLPAGDPKNTVPYLQNPVEANQLTAAVDQLVLDRPEVLIVEDERAVGQMLGLALRLPGFEARGVVSGWEAVEVYRQHHARIALVLMDVQMPGLDGPQTLALLQEIDPQVRCCFMSGNTGIYSDEELLARGGAHVLAKPFHSLAEVARLLRQLAGVGCPPGRSCWPNLLELEDCSRLPLALPTRSKRNRLQGYEFLLGPVSSCSIVDRSGSAENALR